MRLVAYAASSAESTTVAFGFLAFGSALGFSSKTFAYTFLRSSHRGTPPVHVLRHTVSTDAQFTISSGHFPVCDNSNNGKHLNKSGDHEYDSAYYMKETAMQIMVALISVTIIMAMIT